MHSIKLPFVVFVILSGSWTRARADVLTLYDGVGLPANQAWLSYNSFGGTSSQSAVAGGVQLGTDLANQSGYSNYTPLATTKNNAFPSLSRVNGFEVAFALTISSENHTSSDRAGFSLIALASDSRGIELGFWNNEIWAQSSTPLFQHAEGISFETTIARNYRLQIVGDTYTLRDANTILLSGAVRDYTAFNGTPGGIPYTLPNYLFLGDDTTSASVSAVVGAITLNSNLSSVPEPTSGMYIALAILLGFMLHRWPASHRFQKFFNPIFKYAYYSDHNRNARRLQRFHAARVVRTSQRTWRQALVYRSSH